MYCRVINYNLSHALILVSTMIIAINKSPIMHSVITCCYCQQCVHSNIGYQNHYKIDS